MRLLATLLTLVLAVGAHAQPIRFAQLTDAHIVDAHFKAFDKTLKLKDNVQLNKEAFQWAVDEIRARTSAGPAFDFVAFTGDFGLEYLNRSAVPTVAVATAVDLIAPYIKDSGVARWLIVPGNNDVFAENPGNIGDFHDFVAALAAKLKPQGIDVLDFGPPGTPANAVSGVYVRGDCAFFGFDDSTFKELHPAAQAQCVQAVENRLASFAHKHAFIFCHIPDAPDPFTKKPSWADPVARTAWAALVSRPDVRHVFAGHFHSSDRAQYEDLTWISGVGGTYADLSKLSVCPPLAVKFQIGATPMAQGFRDVTVDCGSGEVKSQIAWRPGPPPPSKSSDATSDSSGAATTPTHARTWIMWGIWIVFVVSLLAYSGNTRESEFGAIHKAMGFIALASSAAILMNWFFG